MYIKPFLNVNFCYSCGCPVPRMGVSLRTSSGNISMSSPFYCPKCASKRKKFAQKLNAKNSR